MSRCPHCGAAQSEGPESHFEEGPEENSEFSDDKARESVLQELIELMGGSMVEKAMKRKKPAAMSVEVATAGPVDEEEELKKKRF